MAMTRYQLPQTPGWASVPDPHAARNTLILKVAGWAIVLGVLTIAAQLAGILARPFGFVTPLLVLALLSFLRNGLAAAGWRNVGRILLAGATIAALAVIAVGAPAPQAEATVKPKTKVEAKAKAKPVTVEAAQAEATEHAKNVVAQLWEQVATAFSEAKEAK